MVRKASKVSVILVVALVAIVFVHLYARDALRKELPVAELLTVEKHVEPSNLQVGDKASVTITIQSHSDKDMEVTVTDHFPASFVVCSPLAQFEEVKKSSGAGETVVTWVVTLSPRDRWKTSYEISPTVPSKELSLPQVVVDWNGTRFHSTGENTLRIAEISLVSLLLVQAMNWAEGNVVNMVGYVVVGVAGWVLGSLWRKRKSPT